MARLHAYSSDAKESALWLLKMGGYLAVMSLAANSVLQPLLAGHWLEKIASPVSVGILAPLLYSVYNRCLWRIFAGLPDLNGTWIGMAQPNYHPEAPYLQVMQIVQTWSSINIHVEAYRLLQGTTNWHEGLQSVGKDDSQCATVSQLVNRRSKVEFTVKHTGNGNFQMNFDSTVILDVIVPRWQARFFKRIWRVMSSFFVNRNDSAVAEGHYYTNRFYPGQEGRRCSWGPMYYIFVSSDSLTIDEVLRRVSADQLAEVQKKLVALSAASPDYVRSKLESLESRMAAIESASNGTPNSLIAPQT